MSDRTIWKFPIAIGSVTLVSIPAIARVLMVGLDPASGDPAIWVELDPDEPRVDRGFAVYGTGWQIAGNGGFPSDIHVGSVIQGPFVWHVYERRA